MTSAFVTGVGRTVEAVRAEAKQLDPAKVALTLLMVLPFVIGFVAKKTVGVVWLVVSWLWTAALVGWRAAGKEGVRPWASSS